MDQVDDQRVPTQRKKRSRHYRRLVLRNRGPSAITVHHVPEEQPDQDDAEPGQQRPVIRHYHALWYDTERQEQEALRVEVLGQYVLAGGEYEGVQVVGGVVDDHHDDGDAAGRIHLPKPIYVLPHLTLRTRLLSGFPDHTPPLASAAWVRIGL